MKNSISYSIKNLPKNVKSKKACFVFIDMQDKYNHKTYGHINLTRTVEAMVKFSSLLEIDQIVSEHAPKTFGRTIPEIKANLNTNANIFEKKTFSALSEDVISSQNYESYILTGIETHICVMQTAIQLRNCNKEVFLLEDCVTSANDGDRRVALRLLRESGIILISSASLLMNILGGIEHPKFKECVPLMKTLVEIKSELLTAKL